MCTLTPIPLLLKFTYLKIDKPGNNQALVCLWVGVGVRPSVMQEGWEGGAKLDQIFAFRQQKLLHHSRNMRRVHKSQSLSVGRSEEI